MLLLIDNYDSFTYNLAQAFGELGCDTIVKRNDELSLADVRRLNPDHICISPGPCTPRQAGISTAVIASFGSAVPILGVCLGHQCIAEAYGGKVVRARTLVHGKASIVQHDEDLLFANVPQRFPAGRYHSLVVDRTSVPASLLVTATDDGGEIMAVAHREFPTRGVQFHPESILTPDGKTILRNFVGV